MDFILIEFNKSDITNLNKDNPNNNRYFIEIAKLKEESKTNDDIEWKQIAHLNDDQTKYIVNHDIELNQKYSIRIKSINDFEYIQYNKTCKVIEIVSQKYHPYECRLEYEHSETEWYHPKGKKKLSYCDQCKQLGALSCWKSLLGN